MISVLLKQLYRLSVNVEMTFLGLLSCLVHFLSVFFILLRSGLTMKLLNGYILYNDNGNVSVGDNMLSKIKLTFLTRNVSLQLFSLSMN